MAAVDAADLALRLGIHHPDFLQAKVEMDQRIACLTEDELEEFSHQLDIRRGTLSLRPE